MKIRVPALALFAGAVAALTASRIAAQQKPIYGCNAAPSCRPLGFAELNRDPGMGGMFFGVGMSWGPGANVYLVSPANFTLVRRSTPAPKRELFHLNVSLLPPTPAVTPKPTPGPSASKEPPKS